MEPLDEATINFAGTYRRRGTGSALEIFHPRFLPTAKRIVLIIVKRGLALFECLGIRSARFLFAPQPFQRPAGRGGPRLHRLNLPSLTSDLGMQLAQRGDLDGESPVQPRI